jgi:hypothetical protein
LQLTAVFETWHLGDGNYPPLHNGQLVNLSFEFMPYSLVKSTELKPSKFEQVKDAEYSFAGTVLKVYGDPPKGKLVVVQADDFRFYINSFPTHSPLLKEGDRCEGFGRLLLDYYIWVEFLSSYKDPPDLFYSLRLTSIRAVKIPDSFVSRTVNAQAGPASLGQDDYSNDDIQEVERMEDSHGNWSFYLVAFDDSDVGSEKIPLTFHT